MKKKGEEVGVKAAREKPNIATTIGELSQQMNHYFSLNSMKTRMLKDDIKGFSQKIETGLSNLDQKIQTGLSNLDQKIDTGLSNLDTKIETGPSSVVNEMHEMNLKIEDLILSVASVKDKVNRIPLELDKFFYEVVMRRT